MKGIGFWVRRTYWTGLCILKPENVSPSCRDMIVFNFYAGMFWLFGTKNRGGGRGHGLPQPLPLPRPWELCLVMSLETEINACSQWGRPLWFVLKGLGSLYSILDTKSIWWYKPDSHKFVARKMCAWKRRWQSLYLFSVSHRAGEIWGQVSNFGCLTHARESGLQDQGNFFLWNPESVKYLLLEPRTVEPQTIRMGKQRIRNPECGVQNPGLFWIPLYGQGGLPTLAVVEESG